MSNGDKLITRPPGQLEVFNNSQCIILKKCTWISTKDTFTKDIQGKHLVYNSYWCIIGPTSILPIVLYIFLKWLNIFYKNNGALSCVRNIHGPQLKNEYLKEAIYPAIKNYKNATEEEEVNRIFCINTWGISGKILVPFN